MFEKEIALRNGIPIEKGVVLTKDYLDKNAPIMQQYLNYWLLYPDMYLDAIQSSEDKNFHLMFYQRIALRACMRYRYHSWTATRATSKSFIAYLSSVLKAVFLPGSKLIIVSDVKGTVIKIAKQKFEEIYHSGDMRGLCQLVKLLYVDSDFFAKPMSLTDKGFLTKIKHNIFDEFAVALQINPE